MAIPPTNSLVTPLLTDLYQLTMVYGYWKSGKHNEKAVFDLYFRKNPFQGEFTIFAGLQEVLAFVENFRFSEGDIEYLREKEVFGENTEEEFFQWLRALDTSELEIYAPAEGTLVFPREPLIRVEGPLAIAQLMETTFLTLVNYPSLMATNAARFRLAAGYDSKLLEFGLRRAQGPDGGISASRYSYIGGFDATSNVLAGKLFNIMIQGTHAHAFVSAFSSTKELTNTSLEDSSGQNHNFVQLVLDLRKQLGFDTHDGELAAFISYAQSYPNKFLALVDTYDTLHSGVPNFICVALALIRLGYKPMGIRLDSGDLAYLSKEARKMFREYDTKAGDLVKTIIVASNNINESTLLSLNQQGHEINSFGIGTHLVTCQAQPALGCVYKLVQINDQPKIKISQELEKVTLPGKKNVYRLVSRHGHPILDLLTQSHQKAPEPGEKILCRNPIDSSKRVNVIPYRVEPLLKCYWKGKIAQEQPSIDQVRGHVLEQLHQFRSDHLRNLNPTPYKVSVDSTLFDFFHELWEREAPISEMD